MDQKLQRVYVPMTETGFYILFCLQEPQHGYGVGQRVPELTKGELTIGPGTMYGSLSKMEKDGLIDFVKSEVKRKIYVITDRGREILGLEIKRIERLYQNSRGGNFSEKDMHSIFSIADYLDAEAWLQEMHQAGWAFTKATFLCLYHFEKVSPEDVIYQLEMTNNEQDEEYMSLMADYGWEYLDSMVGWLFFRNQPLKFRWNPMASFSQIKNLN